jgi:cell division protein FtsB
MTDTLERDVRARPKPKRGRRWRTMLFVTLLVSLGLVASGVLPVQQYLERETQVNAARDELDALLADNGELQDQSDALLTDQEIERIAREQYGYVRPGEVGYVVITPEGEEIPSSPPQAAPVERDDRSMLQRIWDFITGRDTSPDG